MKNLTVKENGISLKTDLSMESLEQLASLPIYEFMELITSNDTLALWVIRFFQISLKEHLKNIKGE